MTLPHRIEAAEGADRALDADIHESLGNVVDAATVQWHSADETPFYTASLDAALTLYIHKPDMVSSCPRKVCADALRQRCEILGKSSERATQ
ncbi:hypothetical protein UFOVP5_24 [uncultured Caudovirales phage]|uniref:Uncharacterized protein n=1 Tax=uncultured Caudovirales phage TaxID=2100421 RepID=A0A6J5KIX4_9CAUD|nr:hypothetical protein UFOVP5_24 [uncultured Caudovirales phage]